MDFIKIILVVIWIMIGVSFLSLLEQKELSYSQIRKGPNKAGMVGLLQPFCDAIKLFSKEATMISYSNFYVYFWSPIISLAIAMMIWLSFPYFFCLTSFSLSFLFLISCLSLSVYTLMLSGWSSNSNYSLLGSIRSIAQTLSYEICLILIFFSYLFIMASLNLLMFNYFQLNIDFMYLNLFFVLILMVIFLAETNRSPFDFAEGESELVSGFNTEYMSGGFALIFMAEYSSILFMSSFFCLMLMGSSIFYLKFFLLVMLISFSYIWIRASFPRYRYDKLMYLTWKKYLPISLNFLLYFIFMKLYLFLLL